LKKKLESIVWPATRILVRREIDRLARDENKEVIVLEAAQLIEAKWHEQLHQLWVSIIPSDVAVKRVMERNGLTKEEADSRVSCQMMNRERVRHANVVFCTLWDRDFTRVQVHRAWNMLKNRFIPK
jgi:dephospho-CoA kinase